MKFCAIKVVVATILLQIVSVYAEDIGICAVEDLQRDLDNIGVECAGSIGVVLNLEHLPIPEEDLEAALEVVCTAECGLAVATYLVLQCHEFGIPFLLKTFCLPKGMRSRGDYCLQSYPDFINTTVVNNLMVCSDDEICQNGCDNALQEISYELGCCYQALYNSSVAYLLSEVLVVEQVFPIFSVNNPTLWTNCGVPLLEFCPGRPFPRESPQTCDLAGFISRELPDHCAESYALTKNPSTLFTDQGREAYEDICDDECFSPMINYFDRNCYDPIGSVIMSVNCLESDGELGNRCRFSLDERIEDTGIFEDVGYNCDFDNMGCSQECKDSFVKLSNAFGCCYQSVYNNTELISLLLLIGELNPDEVFFFGILSNQTHWENCNVPLINKCLPSSGAIKVSYSVEIIIFAVNFLAILYYM